MGAEVETLRLARGWSALVVTRVDGFTLGAASARGLPAVEDWRHVLETLTDNPAATPGYAVLKYSEGGEVFRGRIAWGGGSLDVVGKRFTMRSFGRRLLAAGQPSKGRVDFDRGLDLLHAGIATALPLAIVERGTPHREVWLITEFVPDAVDLAQVALVLLPRLESDRRRRVKNAITEAIVDLVDRMARHGFGHRDLKASNILLTHWDSRDAPVRPWLVDLEGLRPRRPWSAWRHRRPLVRLAASLLEHPAVTRTDYCRFLHGYLARAGVVREEWKPRYRVLADEAARYVRRAQRRKTGKLDGYGGDP